MNKREFIKVVAVESRQSTVYVAATLDAMMKIFTVCMEQGIKLSLTGFGSFSVHEHPARKGRNPHTGGTIEIAAKRTVKFRPSPRIQLLNKK